MCAVAVSVNKYQSYNSADFFCIFVCEVKFSIMFLFTRWSADFFLNSHYVYKLFNFSKLISFC